MKRKLEIIRSLIHTPKILFLDEPATRLDAVARRGLREYVNHSRRENGITVFLTTRISTRRRTWIRSALSTGAKSPPAARPLT
jgi:ABC-type multidrug transport system ATPase subunit